MCGIEDYLEGFGIFLFWNGKGQQWVCGRMAGTEREEKLGKVRERGRGILTTCAPRTHSAVTRNIGVASDIPHSRINETLARELFPEEVLHTPEAACRHRTFFRRRCGDSGGTGAGTVRREVQTCRGGKGAK